MTRSPPDLARGALAPTGRNRSSPVTEEGCHRSRRSRCAAQAQSRAEVTAGSDDERSTTAPSMLLAALPAMPRDFVQGLYFLLGLLLAFFFLVPFLATRV